MCFQDAWVGESSVAFGSEVNCTNHRPAAQWSVAEQSMIGPLRSKAVQSSPERPPVPLSDNPEGESTTRYRSYRIRRF